MRPFYDAMYEVLAAPKYDILTGRAIDHQQVIIEALGRAILNLLERVNFGQLDAPVYNLGFLVNAFIIAAVLLLLGTAVVITYILITRRARMKRREADTADIFEDIANRRYTLSELLLMAQEYVNKNHYRDAVRYYYIAVLVALDDKRTISVDKSKTNAQLVQDMIKAAPDLTDPFISVVDIFQQVWFGGKAVDEYRYGLFVEKAEEILHVQ